MEGEEFYKSEIDKISKKVLMSCNYLHSKNKNNSNAHKVGGGKLMMTSGMTINDFIKKFNLKIK